MLKPLTLVVNSEIDAAAFGRLRVETSTHGFPAIGIGQPPSGGCVLKPFLSFRGRSLKVSRLRAAAC